MSIGAQTCARMDGHGSAISSFSRGERGGGDGLLVAFRITMPRSSNAFRVTNVDDSWPAELAVSAVSGLMDAVELTPKPALIDRRIGEGSGIELARVRQCILTLPDAFVAIAVASASAPRPTVLLREELGRVGRARGQERQWRL
jgi:hypothetical protein